MADERTTAEHEKGDDLLRELAGLRDECVKLEQILGKLNFFRAVGAARSELRHSDFLAFLLNPREAHGLGDFFLKAWLCKCLTRAKSNVKLGADATRLLDLVATSDLSDTHISRERPAKIDVFILNEGLEFAVIVENKTDSEERERQLSNYWQAIEALYPNFERFGLYLSPRASRTKYDTGQNYHSVGYDTLDAALGQTPEARGGALDPEIRMILEHYRQLVKDEFMGKPEASEIVWNIYRDYPRAADCILENSRQEQMRSEIVRLIDDNGCDLVSLKPGGYYAVFIPEEWRRIPALRDQKWTDDGAGLWFYFKSGVSMWLGANDRRMLELLKRAVGTLPSYSIGSNDGWPTVWTRQILTEADLRKMSRRDVFSAIHRGWQEFKDTELEPIRRAVQRELESWKA